MSLKSVLKIVIILSSPSLVIAQKDFAVLAKGDTLKGELKMYSIDNIDRLQINVKGTKSTFTAFQVKSFVKAGITYQPVRYENALRFMKLVESGYLSLYMFSPTGMGSMDSQYLAKKDGSGMEVPNLSFKKLISKYLNDCPELIDRIEKGEFHKSDIERIVVQYNTCLQAKTETLMQTKDPQTSSSNSAKIVAIETLTKKIEAENFLTKKDVMDVLRDIKNKVSKNENVPNYLTESLKSYLADTPALSKEAEELITTLLKK